MDFNQGLLMCIPSSLKCRSGFVVGLLALSAAIGNGQPTTNAPIATTTDAVANVSTNPTYLRDVLPLFLGKCSRCHNEDSKFLPTWSEYKAAYGDSLEIKRRVWASWTGKYYKQSMPAGNCPECQTITEDDRMLIKTWVETGGAYGVPSSSTTSNPKTPEEKLQLGRHLFTVTCVPCHQASGSGIPNRYPPLAASDFLNADKNRAIKILIHGRQGAITVNTLSFTNSMPAFPLSDEDIADTLTFVYHSFGNSGKNVTAEEVKAARAEKEDPKTPAAGTRAPASKWE